jgi:signal peptide peptidase SppA
MAGAEAVAVALSARLGLSTVVSQVPSTSLTLEAALPNLEPANAGRPFAFEAEGGVAYIPVEGELAHRFGYLDPTSGMTGYDGLAAKLEAASADPAVRGIFLDFDSPGGEVAGCEACVQTILAARAAKPVWALVNELAASAAYWLASTADVIVTPPSGELGSIGVVMLHHDFSGALAEAGIKVTPIHAGDRKVDGAYWATLPEEARARFQADVDLLYGRFVADVARNRGLSDKAVRATEAAVFRGEEAVRLGLADVVAWPEEAWQEFAAKLAAA